MGLIIFVPKFRESSVHAREFFYWLSVVGIMICVLVLVCMYDFFIYSTKEHPRSGNVFSSQFMYVLYATEI